MIGIPWANYEFVGATVGLSGSRVAIVGGSIAGCAAAIALRRAGCAVTVYERSGGVLKDRGLGIVIPAALRSSLVSAGYLGPGLPALGCSGISWLTRGGAAGYGRELARQPFDAVYANWGLLWRALRAGIDDRSYRDSTAVRDVAVDPDGATVVLGDGAGEGARERFDLVVGADGYRSTVRRFTDPAARPEYAGYALWRSSYPASRLTDPGPLEAGLGRFVCFPHGHGVFYLIPAFEPGRFLVNLAVYDSISAFSWPDEPVSLPPGGVGDALAARLYGLITEHFPAYWADVVRRADLAELSVQPVYDMPASRYVRDRSLLIGDAATITRPHTGSGATKALQDALALERACRESENWSDALTRYDNERLATGNRLVDLGRRLAAARVTDTPEWTTMSPPEFQNWLAATAGGEIVPRYGS